MASGLRDTGGRAVEVERLPEDINIQDDKAKRLETSETDEGFTEQDVQEPSVTNHPDVELVFFSTNENDELYLNLVLEYVPETIHRMIKDYNILYQRMRLVYVKLYTYQLDALTIPSSVSYVTTSPNFICSPNHMLELKGVPCSSGDLLYDYFDLTYLLVSQTAQCRPFDQSTYPVSQISWPPSPAPEASVPPVATFSVLSYGAVGDGVADDTSAFKAAWDAACQAGYPAVLLAPKHYTFMIQSAIFSGPCKNGLVFQIEGSLMAPDGPGSWARSNSKRQWLVFYRINGMAMQGGGVIDGRGEKWWDLPCKPHKGIHGTPPPGPCDSPVAIRFFWSTNLTVQGLMIKNSPQFHFRFDSCRDVSIDSLNIKSPARSPNTDGIHVENSNDVKIYNSLISNGDDCVSIGAGTYNVDIRNITCGPSHGISIGSLGIKKTRACVSNITVTDSLIRHSDNGVRIKTWQGGYGTVSNVAFSNIHMDTVRNPIIIDQYYCSSKACPNQTSAVYVTDVSYTGIRGTYDVRSPPVHLACSDTVPCTNITIDDVELYPAQGQRMWDPFCWNAYGDIKTLTIPPLFCLLEGFPVSRPRDDVDKC